MKPILPVAEMLRWSLRKDGSCDKHNRNKTQATTSSSPIVYTDLYYYTFSKKKTQAMYRAIVATKKIGVPKWVFPTHG